MKPALTYDEWSKGTNKDPILEEFDQDALQNKLQGAVSQGVGQAFAFQKKPGAGAPEAVKQIQDKPAAGGAASAGEISKLQQEVNQQKSIIAGNE